MANETLLQVQNLTKHFDIKRGFFWGEAAKVPFSGRPRALQSVSP